MEVVQQRCGRFLGVRPPPPPWSDPFVNSGISRMPYPPLIPFCPYSIQNQPRPPICLSNHHRPPPLNFVNQPSGPVYPQQNPERDFRPPINPVLLAQLAQVQVQNGFHQTELHPNTTREHNKEPIANSTNKGKKSISPSTALRERAGLSGYSRRLFVDKIPDDLICALCQDVVRKPLQTKCCGQVYCKVCINRLPRIVRGILGCPHCREKLEVFIDKRAENFVNNMKIFCINVKRGCSWLGQLTNLKAHLDNCKLSQNM